MDEQKESNIHRPMIGWITANPVYCRTCCFAHGKPPFEDDPEKAYCRIFGRDDSEGKPMEVYYKGEPCEYYEKDNRKFEK
ncbi:MAG: hypothetical protein HFH26_11565 [Clostridiaceae bacterium]|nr:hypothetical protein [Clostridiaceae bacterium]